MGLEYADIFYSHRFDPDTPLEEIMAALDPAVRRGTQCFSMKALVSSIVSSGASSAIR